MCAHLHKYTSLCRGLLHKHDMLRLVCVWGSQHLESAKQKMVVAVVLCKLDMRTCASMAARAYGLAYV